MEFHKMNGLKIEGPPLPIFDAHPKHKEMMDPQCKYALLPKRLYFVPWRKKKKKNAKAKDETKHTLLHKKIYLASIPKEQEENQSKRRSKSL